MHQVSRVDWTFSDRPPDLQGHAAGLARKTLVGRAVGASHTELSAARLDPGGHVDRHIHSFEQAFYVLAGAPTLELGDRSLLLEPGDFALAPIGLGHGWRNDGGDEARWISVSTRSTEGSTRS